MTRPAWAPTPTRSTARLRLRPYTENDEDRAFFVGLVTDPVVMAHLDGALDAETATGVFGHVIALTRRRAWWLWAIETVDRETPVGHAELKPNRELGAIEIVYMLGSAHWRQGYAGEAGAELVRAAEHGPDRPVVATVDPRNAASRAVLHRIGMRHWGELTSDGLAVYRLPGPGGESPLRRRPARERPSMRGL